MFVLASINTRLDIVLDLYFFPAQVLVDSSNVMLLFPGERGCSNQMCESKHWVQSTKASCCIYHLQMSSSLEII